MWLKMLWSLVARFLPGGKTLSIVAVVALAGFSSGAWVAHKYFESEKVQGLYDAITALEETHVTSLLSLDTFYQGELARAKANVRIQEVVKYVPNDAVCNVPADPVRVLDAARQGVPEPTAKAAGSARESAAPVGISQRQLYRADADLADRFQSCRQQVQELNRWYESTRNQ